MPLTNILEKTRKFEIEAHRQVGRKNRHKLAETHVAYTGAAQKHPKHANKVILIPDPFSANTFFYEFEADDVDFAEEVSNIVDLDGDIVTLARIWVKKGSVGIRCTPFVVEDTRIIR